MCVLTLCQGVERCLYIIGSLSRLSSHTPLVGRSRWRWACKYGGLQGQRRRDSTHERKGRWGEQAAQTPLGLSYENRLRKKAISLTSALGIQHLWPRRFQHWRHVCSLLKLLSSLGNSRGLTGFFKLPAASHQRPLETYKVSYLPFQVTISKRQFYETIIRCFIVLWGFLVCLFFFLSGNRNLLNNMQNVGWMLTLLLCAGHFVTLFCLMLTTTYKVDLITFFLKKI